MNATKVNTESVNAYTTLQDPLHQAIRKAVVAAYRNEFNVGKDIDPFLVEAIVANVWHAVGEWSEDGANKARDAAIDALIGERDYQDAGCGNAADTNTGSGPGRPLTPGECLLTIKQLAAQAEGIWYRPQSGAKLQHWFRKIGGVALQALERYGAPARVLSSAQQDQVDDHKAATQFATGVLEALSRRASQGVDGQVGL